MPRESNVSKRKRLLEMCEILNERYPDAECALHFETPFQCVISVALSAQTTDAAVNKVTPELYSKYGTPELMAQADYNEVTRILRPIGFFRNKARNAIDCARMIMSDFGGEVPSNMQDLQRLPAVGRKTANIVMNNAFGIVEGIAVDTHVNRIAHRMRFVSKNICDPNKVEAQLLALIPQEMWGPINHQWVLFGREICEAKRPLCACDDGECCPLADICPSGVQ